MATTWRAGFAKSDITPQVGVELCGFGWNIGRKSTGVLEPLYASAFVWQSGDRIGAIVSCDLIGIDIRITLQARRLIEQACGIPGDHVMIACTHTHSAPTTIDIVAWGEKDEDYLAGLPQRIANAVIEAAGQLQEVSLEYGDTQVEGISYNRESHSKTNPGGLTDTTLKVIKCMHGGRMIGFLSHYSCHPVVMCEKTSLITGDFVGAAMNKLGAKYGAVGLFLQGSLGDQNPVYCHEELETSIRNLETLSDRFAQAVEAALASTKPIDADDAAVSRIQIRLEQQQVDRSLVLRNKMMVADMFKYYDELPAPVQRRLRFERDVLEFVWARFDNPPAGYLETELQAFRFGNMLFLAHPTELFFEYHRPIEQALAPYTTFLIGTANDAIGYIPSPDKYDVTEGKYSYPAWFTPFMLKQHPFVQDIAIRLSEQLVQLGKSV